MSDESFDVLLESFQSDPSASTASGGSPSLLKRGISYSHNQMIDLIVGNPGISQSRIAEITGYSESWLSQIINSDAFQSRLAERRAQLVDPTIREQVEKGLDVLCKRSVEVLIEKLKAPASMISDTLAMRTLEVASRARGYGARTEDPPPTVNVEVHLNELGDGLTKLLRRRRMEVIEGSPSEAQP